MTMPIDQDPKPPGWDEPPIPLRERRSGGRFFQQLSIRNLMLALVYFAIVSLAIRGVMESDGIARRVLLAVVIGLGLAGAGLWMAFRLPRSGFVGWVVFVIGYLVVTGATINVFAIPSIPVLIGAIVYLHIRKRATDQAALLWVLDVAAERGLPLAPGVQAFAGQSTGMFRIWAESLAGLLRGGVTLPEALAALPRLAPRRDALLIRMGGESGDLAAGLHAATLARSGRTTSLAGFGARLSYLAWVSWLALAIVSFVMYFIVPKFEAIFQDFGVDLPELTKVVIQGSHYAIEYAWIFTLLGFALLAWATLYLANPSGGLPLIDRFFPRRHTILILRALAVVVDAGRPIAPALRALAQWHPSGWVRKRLGHAALDAEQGLEWTEALLAAGLLTREDVGVLGAARRAGNLPWALRELAETGERRRGYRLQFWSQVVFILTVLAMGAMIFLLAVAYFLPLTTLILRLS